MNFKVGDYVTRISYKNDTVFKIVNIKGDMAYLKGMAVRLVADAILSDLTKVNYLESDDNWFNYDLMPLSLDRNDYFYLPAKILHVDGDKDYLNRCLNFYKSIKCSSFTVHFTCT